MDNSPDEETQKSLYDPDPKEEADLWFLPDPAAGPAADPVGQSGFPSSRADPHPLVQTKDWQTAEAGQAGALARAASLFGALDERLRKSGSGWVHRLILMEVAEMSWHLGTRLAQDRLALYLAKRLSGAAQDAQELLQAGWAVRRLTSSAPVRMGALAGFLGREHVRVPAPPDLLERPQGQELDGLFSDWEMLIGQAGALHPITRAALGWHMWRLLGLSGDAALIEGAVVAARIGAEAGRGGAGFLPVALSGASAYLAGGTAAMRLETWYDAVARACLRGLMECDRVDRWQLRAVKMTAGMSGRTPPRLTEALTAWPLVSAPMLEARIGVSRAAVQRNMTRFEDLGLVQEVTGQGRFRFWRLTV